MSRIALLTLKGRNEEKVKYSAAHVKRELEKLPGLPRLTLTGPAPAPLARTETKYRYQIMLRTRQMAALSRKLAGILRELQLPDDVSIVIDIDPVNLI